MFGLNSLSKLRSNNRTTDLITKNKIEQVKLIYKDFGLSTIIDAQKEFKINRLIKRIENE